MGLKTQCRLLKASNNDVYSNISNEYDKKNK